MVAEVAMLRLEDLAGGSRQTLRVEELELNFNSDLCSPLDDNKYQQSE